MGNVTTVFKDLGSTPGKGNGGAMLMETYYREGAPPPLPEDFPVEVFSDICVCRQVVEVKSAAGLILPGEEKKTRAAEVIAAGPGRTYENGVTVPNPIKVGDVVVFGKYASGGEPLWFRGNEFLLFRANDVIGKLCGAAVPDDFGPGGGKDVG